MQLRWKNTSAGYGAPSVALHWATLLLMALAYALMEFKSVFPKGSAGRGAMAELHYFVGLSVFAIAWLRLFVRLPGTAPAIDPPLPPWQMQLAKAVHIALYVLLFALPLTGWLMLSAKGTPLSFFGVTLPALIVKSRSIAKVLEDIHEFLANAGYFLIGLHAAAALFHHHIKRDNTLRLMWFR